MRGKRCLRVKYLSAREGRGDEGGKNQKDKELEEIKNTTWQNMVVQFY